MSETITVKSATLISDGVIEVKGAYGRAIREYTVHFHLLGKDKGAINFGQRWIPDDGYMPPSELPEAVKAAAIAEFQKTSKS